MWMRYGREGQESQEEARAATIMSVETPIPPSENERSEALPQQNGIQRQGISLLRQAPLTWAGVLVLVVLTFALVFADGGRAPAHTTPRQARATPTATATVVPSPTAAPGFQMYVDQGEDFRIQYPQDWAYSVNHPGIQFVNDAANLGFVMDVIVPNDTSGVPPDTGPEDAAIYWVNHVMRDYASQFQDQFQQLPGPNPTAHFGGATWQSGVALLGSGSSRVRVQIYATMHNDKPYVIAVLAADNIFSFGSTQYFEPMLQSFQFLSPSAS
jgi:hypothetical protein